MQVAERAASVFVGYLNASMCSGWMPPFYSESQEASARDVAELMRGPLGTEPGVSGLLTGIREGIHAVQDRHSLEAFAEAVAAGAFHRPSASERQAALHTHARRSGLGPAGGQGGSDADTCDGSYADTCGDYYSGYDADECSDGFGDL